MTSSTLSESRWDQTAALQNVGGCLEDLKDLLALSLEQSPSLVAKIAVAVQRHDADDLYLAAHTLKSSLQLFVMEPSGEIAASLELAGRTRQWESCPQLLQQLQQSLDELNPEIHAFLEA